MSDEGSNFKLFVGNLPTDCSDDDLRQVFKTYGELSEVHVLQPRGKSGMKCAFVVYKQREAAEDAIKLLDHIYKIRENAEEPIEVRWARDGKGGGKACGASWNDGWGGGVKGGKDPAGPGRGGNKMPSQGPELFVGSLPSDCTEEDLKTVFSTYGEVKALHFISSPTGSPLKCAFVMYARQESAEDAIKVLHGVYKMRESAEQPVQVRWANERTKGAGKDGGKGGDAWGGGKCGGGKAGDGGWQAVGSWQDWQGGWQDGSSAWGGGWDKGGCWDKGGGKGGWQDGPGWWDGKGGGAWGGCKGGDDGWQCGKGGKDWYGCTGGGKDWKGGKGDDWKGKGGDWTGGKGCDWKGGKGDGWKGGKGDGWKGGKGDSVSEAPSKRLYVANLPEDIAENALEYVFNTYGKVEKVHIMTNKAINGCVSAFVELTSPEDAETAILSLNNKYEIRAGYGPILVRYAVVKNRSSPY
mmetsp:Transcript_10306/g.32030  ORF Transcript_10306/g.32030 Transcript_10306/m.32030 type:complete len:466 (-) Transcript_10306:67-1464(-)